MDTDADYSAVQHKAFREADEKAWDERSRQETNRIVDEKIRDEQFYREVEQLQYFLQGQP